MIGRDERGAVLRFALGFAFLATVVWTVLVALDSESKAANTAYNTYMAVNFGGSFLTFLIQLLVGGALLMLPVESDPTMLAFMPGLEWLSWAGVLSTVFVGAFVQGVVYGALGLVGVRWCRRRREPRVALHDV